MLGGIGFPFQNLVWWRQHNRRRPLGLSDVIIKVATLGT